MPGWLLMQLPLIEGARAPSISVVVGMLCLAVYSGYALTALLSRDRWLSIRSQVWAAGILIITGVEYISPMQLSEIPNVSALQKIARDRQPGVLAYIPLSFRKSALPQAYHDRKLLTVKIGRLDTDISQYYWRHEALQFLALPHGTTRLPTPDEANYLIDLLGLRYVILDVTAYDPKRSQQIRALLRNTYGLCEIHSDTRSSILRLEGPTRPSSELSVDLADDTADMHLVYGWSNRESFGSNTAAWMIRQSAIIAVPPFVRGSYNLELDLLTLSADAFNLRITVAYQVERDFTISSGPSTLSIEMDPEVMSSTETNLIRLETGSAVGLPYTTGHGRRPSSVTPTLVNSGGYYTAEYGLSNVTVGQTEVLNDKRGWFFVVADSGRVIETRLFRGLDPESTVENIRNYIERIPEGVSVAIAKRTLGHIRGGTVGEAFEAFGFKPSFNPNHLNSFSAIVERNGRPPIFSEGAALATVAIGDHLHTSEAAIAILSVRLTPK